MPRRLAQHPVHLGLGASAVVEPAFSGNDAGVWHTADVQEHGTALFVTAGIGTQIRPR